MNNSSLVISTIDNKLLLKFSGELNLYVITSLQKQLDSLNTSTIQNVDIDLQEVSFIDTAVSIFINNLQTQYIDKNIKVTMISNKKDIDDTLFLIKNQKAISDKLPHANAKSFLYSFGKSVYEYYIGLLAFLNFLGNLFATKIYYIKSLKHIRIKEIMFEINESGIKALPIVALTSFLIGIVIAYQSAFQLKIYGANIFLVDMLGISILRELAPLLTAIVIAGRSGSAFTAQIGAMKITEELDAMRTMGFDPYAFLVMPRILALMLVMPILIFVADMMGVLGGMLVANLDLQITPTLFMDRFNEVVAPKHFFIGILKGPFFAFLIATIGIYRGLMVKNDTQSIGFNTTKSVVESIFSVIICDAVFSIAFTNLGI